MVMMVIRRVSVGKRLCQDLRSKSVVFENLLARGAWVFGYVPSRPSLNSIAPLETRRLRYLPVTEKAPGSPGVVRTGRPEGRILFVSHLGVSPVWLAPKSSSFFIRVVTHPL
jgi:hypothetical protein